MRRDGAVSPLVATLVLAAITVVGSTACLHVLLWFHWPYGLVRTVLPDDFEIDEKHILTVEAYFEDGSKVTEVLTFMD